MPRDVDEDLIEATIRRVAESQAAQRPTPPIEMPVADALAPPIAVGRDEGDDDDFDPPVEPISAPSFAPPARPGALASFPPAPPPPPLFTPREPARSPAAAPSPVSTDGDEISLALFEVTQTIQSLSQRLDAIVPLLERIAQGGGHAPAPLLVPSGDNGPSRAPIAGPWQPTPTQGTSALEPQVIDTRPLPKPLPPLQVEPKRGFDLLPKSYRITVEDKRRGVDLVPLHRALLSMDGVRDMALLSYNNGVALVSVETTADLDPDALGASVGRAMSREARVEVHNEHTMVVKLAED